MIGNNMVSEIELNKRFDTLVEQRNNALNSIVILEGQLAVANAKIEELQKQLDSVKPVRKNAP